jgi:transcriptional regulator, XRE family
MEFYSLIIIPFTELVNMFSGIIFHQRNYFVDFLSTQWYNANKGGLDMVFSFDVLLSRLQEAKVLKKMRIEDISKKSNVPVGTISKIFAGITTDPKIGTLIAIADALDANIDYLIYGKREINTDTTFSEKECNIIKKYRQLTAEQQGAIENNIDYFIQVNKKDETTENGEDPFANKVG